MTGSGYPDNFNTSAFEHKIKAGLFRFDCPTPLQLGEYYLNLLSPDLKEAIANHLKTCLSCKKELNYLREFIIAPINAKNLDKKEEAGICKIIPFKQHFPYQESSLPLANVRSDNDKPESRKLILNLPGNDSLVLFYDISRETTGYTFSGQFVPSETLETRIIGALVEIWQDNEIQTACQVDDLCAFRFKLLTLTPAIMRISSLEGLLFSSKLDLDAP